MLLTLLLLALLTGHAIWQIWNIEHTWQERLSQRTLKIQLASDLLEAAYARHTALINQILISDAFIRDEYVSEFHRAGFKVGLARNQLRALPLDAFELANLTTQSTLIADIVPLQERIVDLAAADDIDTARTLAVSDALRIDRHFDETIQSLRQYERKQIEIDGAASTQALHQALWQSLLFGGGILGIALALTLRVQRLLQQREGAIALNADALEAHQRDLQEKALHDPLTGLANRRLFTLRLEQALEGARLNTCGLALVFIDLDRFKETNDTLGHAAGDAMLQRTARQLSQIVRQGDTLARLGGDEFAMIVCNVTDAFTCDDIPRRIRQQLRMDARHDDALYPETECSIGVSYSPDGNIAAPALLAEADHLMYADKQARQSSPARP